MRATSASANARDACVVGLGQVVAGALDQLQRRAGCRPPPAPRPAGATRRDRPRRRQLPCASTTLRWSIVARASAGVWKACSQAGERERDALVPDRRASMVASRRSARSISSSADRSSAATTGCSRSAPVRPRSATPRRRTSRSERAGAPMSPTAPMAGIADGDADRDHRTLAVADDRRPPQVELAPRAHGADRVARVVDAGEQVARLPRAVGLAAAARVVAQAGDAAVGERIGEAGEEARRPRRRSRARTSPRGRSRSQPPSRSRGSQLGTRSTQGSRPSPSGRVSVAASDSVAGAEAELLGAWHGPMVRSGSRPERAAARSRAPR